MNKKILVTLIMGMFLISFASALTYKVDNELDWRLTCLNDGYCSDSSYCNVSIISPNNTVIVSNVQLTNNGYYHNVTIPGTSLLETGKYDVNGFCIDGIFSDEIDLEFDITKTGNEFKLSEGVLYFVLVFGLLVFLLLSLYGGISIPYRNNYSDDGKLISVNDLRYVKILSLFAAYGILTWLANIMVGISNNYIDLGLALGFFTIMFKIMMFALYPVMIFTVIFIGIEMVKGFKANKLLSRGLS